jgi:UDP-N-acetylmuramoyl-tripeptide--D-alanyl-D-alanine ligase
VVAVTGSAGKTSVKQLMHSVLSEKYRTLMTQGNLNNHIGAPLTLLSLSAEHQAAVIELGASGLGEIAYTAKWVKPRVGIITNAAHAHIQGFGSLEGVVQTKGELLDFIAPDGCAVLNADDAFCETWVKRAQGKRILRFGLNSTADVRAKHIQLSLSGSQFLLCYQNQQQLVHLPLLGEHNVRNALAVAAAALALNFTLAEIANGLSKAQNVQGRLQWVAGKKGERILNDAYNANPASVRAAIDVLKHSKNNFLVMGDMAELGSEEIALHQEVGLYAKAQGIQHFFATGLLSKASVEAFGDGALWFSDKKSLSIFLQKNTTAGAVVLVKGSRSAAMDDIVRDLQITSGE